jgi:transcriptional regulator with XRE-family HTH domain
MTEKDVVVKIEEYLVKHNLRQYELAKELGIPESTLNRWLRRKTNISKAYLMVLRTKGII